MPIDKYYKGHGKEVMANMKKEYGEKKGESVFYAKANKDKSMKPSRGKSKSSFSKKLKAGKSPLGLKKY